MDGQVRLGQHHGTSDAGILAVVVSELVEISAQRRQSCLTAFLHAQGLQPFPVGEQSDIAAAIIEIRNQMKTVHLHFSRPAMEN